MYINSCEVSDNKINNKTDFFPSDLISDIYLIKPKSKNIYDQEILKKLSLFKNKNSEKLNISLKEIIYENNKEKYYQLMTKFNKKNIMILFAIMMMILTAICNDILISKYKFFISLFVNI